MLRCVNLTKTYSNQDSPVLQNVNLHVKPGDIFGIIGKSGAGKSTLVRCLNLIEPIDAGEIWFDGVNLCAADQTKLRQMRQQIAMVFQHFNLLESRTVWQNVALPLEIIGLSKEEQQQRIKPLLELVELDHRADAKPSQLSGGQKQRVGIARALAMQPKLLLADEATSALDIETTQRILTLLKKINKTLNLTLIIITHEMNVVKDLCDQIAVIDGGQIVEQAKTLALFSNPQSEMAKQLTQTALHTELPDRIKMRIQDSIADANADINIIARFAFVGDYAQEPLLSELQSRFKVSTSILEADLQTIQNGLFGVTVCELLGEFEAQKKSIRYMAERGINAHILGYVSK